MAPPESPVSVVRLRRGVTVAPRGDGFLQVGSDPAHRVLLPDTPAVARGLAQLRHGVTTSHEGPQAVVRALAAARLLVDVAEERLLCEARAGTRVALDVSAPWQALATQLLAATGLAPVSGAAARDITWVITAGEPARETYDPLLCDDDPILFVAVFDSRVRVGPFVLPGTTACLRCIDAQTDPWKLPQRSRHDPEGSPDDVSPLLLHRAMIAAAADLCAWAEGRQPATWSRSHWYDEQFTCSEQQWQRHSHCGCSWADTLTG